MNIGKISVGRIVHYRVGGTDEAPELRAAIVVRTFGSDNCANLQVTVDGSNDAHRTTPSGGEMFTTEECHIGLAWKTSALEGTEVGQWRWPARA